MNWKVYLIELLGAFAVTFFGAYSRIQNQGDILAVGLSYFMIVFGITHAFQYISGGHFNPALTIALAFLNQVDRTDALYYLLAQILGSLFAGLFVFASVPRDTAVHRAYYGYPQLYESQKFMAASLDMVSVFLLVFVAASILSNVKYRSIFAPAMAGIYMVNILAFGALSGGCVNFLEALGPGLFGLSFKYWPFYLGAHVLGATAAVGVYSTLVGRQPLDHAAEDDNEDETADERKKKD